MKVEARKENNTLTITLEGEINNMASPAFEKAYMENREDIRDVVIDMEKASYLTSAALRVILFIQQEMNDRGGSLTVCRVNEDIMEVLNFTGFSGFLTIQ